MESAAIIDGYGRRLEVVYQLYHKQLYLKIKLDFLICGLALESLVQWSVCLSNAQTALLRKLLPQKDVS